MKKKKKKKKKKKMNTNSGFPNTNTSLKDINLFLNDDINISNNTKEKIITFLLQFYKTRQRFNYNELEDVNIFLNLIINKFKKNESLFFQNLLLTHFEHATNQFISFKIKEKYTNYIDNIKQYFFLIFDLGLYIVNRKKNEKNNLVNPSNIDLLLIYMIKYLKLFLVHALNQIKANYFDELYCTVIIESEIINTLTSIFGQNEKVDNNIIHCFVLLTEYKKFSEAIIKCNIVKKLTEELLLMPHNEKSNIKHHLITQIIMNMVIINQKNAKLLINKNENEYINNILKKLYEKIKNKQYDLTSIDLLKIFFYFIQSGSSNNSIYLLLKNSNNGIKQNLLIVHENILFFDNVNKIIEYLSSDVIKSDNINKINDKQNDLFCEFLSFLFFVLRYMLDVIFSSSNDIKLKPFFYEHSIKIKKKSKKNMNEHVKNLTNNILNFCLNFLIQNNSSFQDEKKILHLLCFNIIIYINSNHFITFTEFEKKTCSLMVERATIALNTINIVNLKEEHTVTKNGAHTTVKNVEHTAVKNDNYLYINYFELLYYISINKEEICKECFDENFILLIEKIYYQIHSDANIENVNEKETHILLKLYFIGIIYTFIKINYVQLKNKSESMFSFIHYIIKKELKNKSFLLENEIYFLTFLKLLNISLMNNIIHLNIFFEKDYLKDLLKIIQSSNTRIKEA
ncbi:conserved protein, unknown function, partial [Hepatocystis sp. ex Piliocolobus tephrosceles]